MLRFVRSWSAISRSLLQFASARRPHARRRFTLERLESRSLLSTVHLTVNTLADDPGGPVAGQTTLRDAITAADAGSAANKYVIKFAVDGTIALAAPLPNLANNIVIRGPGAENLAIQGNNMFTILVVNSSNTVNVSGVTIEDGHNGGDAGGIWNTGALTVSSTIFTDNTAFFGGGIENDGTVTVNNSEFIGNSANYGGGIFNNDGTATINDSTFSGNSAIAGNGVGGGLCNNGGTATVIDSLFSSNSAIFGGGISNGGLGKGGTMTVDGSIFIRNSAGDGGGIFNGGTPLTVDRSVFIGNSATYGGAIFNDVSATIDSNIFIGNSATDGGGIYNLNTMINTRNLFLDNTGGDIEP